PSARRCVYEPAIIVSDKTAITIYARRTGEDILSNGNFKDIHCSGNMVTAWAYEIYKDINYITCFGFKYTYFLYDE
ncbi:MAG: hypothetical protein K2H20_03405, partial [Bacilli bacterium]|nr:hypothetical protein [Bacilli bacterium]